MKQPREPTPAELQAMNQELSKTDSEGLPTSVVSQLTYSVPLVYDLSLEGDTLDGGEFRIPIVLEYGKPVIVTLTPLDIQNILKIQVQRSTCTTPNG